VNGSRQKIEYSNVGCGAPTLGCAALRTVLIGKPDRFESYLNHKPCLTESAQLVG
jgi:hypothetical protein